MSEMITITSPGVAISTATLKPLEALKRVLDGWHWEEGSMSAVVIDKMKEVVNAAIEDETQRLTEEAARLQEAQQAAVARGEG